VSTEVKNLRMYLLYRDTEWEQTLCSLYRYHVQGHSCSLHLYNHFKLLVPKTNRKPRQNLEKIRATPTIEAKTKLADNKFVTV
jgi:hypothetical protein